MKVALIGAGAWSSALANVLADNGHSPVLFARKQNQVQEINESHQNSKYLGDVLLNPSIQASISLKETLRGASMMVFAVPSHAIRSVAQEVAPFLEGRPLILNVAKGFDPITFEGFTQTLEELFPKERIRGVVSLMGPSFAKEVANHQRTAVCAVGHNQKCNEEVQHLFSNDYFRVYTQDDVIGAEIGAGMKNIIAIASGILSGLGYENNSRAALITRGLAEITRFGLAKGAKEKTFLGLTGIGDLFLTCSSPMSRNFSAGVEIGKADSAENFLKNNKTTVEGIEACRLVHQEAKRIGVSVPITDAIYAILFHRLRPSAVVSLLMNRALKAE